VLDGFTIEGHVLAAEDDKVEKVKNRDLSKYYFTIFISVMVHAILASALLFIADKPQIKAVKVEAKAIKSYLYKMPIKAKKSPPKPEIKKEQVKKIAAKEKPVAVKQALDKQMVNKKALTPAALVKTTSLPKPKPKPKPKQQSKPRNSVVTAAVQQKTDANKSVKATFSAYKQLNNLRSAINEKLITEQLSARQQFRSPSVMHGKQFPVPHSTIQMTAEQKKTQNTTRMSDSISITKYDDGLCVINREQFLGSPIEASSSAFACGESKFDKSFRAHMKKVQEKLLPVRKK